MNKILHASYVGLVFAVACCAGGVAQGSAAGRMDRYNVIWNSPSQDASGVMPLGNGDIAAGVYAMENGDLYLLLSKNDAYNYMGDLFKTGRVRVALSPNPFLAGKPFRQTLDLATGSIRIEADGVAIRIWADANHPVYHIEINSPADISVTASPDLWQRVDHTVYNETAGYTVNAGSPPPQDVRLERDGQILWHYSVGDRSVYPDDLAYYAVPEMAALFPDPYRFNNFGNLLECPQLTLQQGVLTGSGKSFDIRIHALTRQTPDAAVWVDGMVSQAAATNAAGNTWQNHCDWWSGFWDRSWIMASDNTLAAAEREKFNGEPAANGSRVEPDGAALVSQSYNVFRFLMACQSRGRVPTKFNGGIFTQELRLNPNDGAARTQPTREENGYLFTHPDDRLWGRRFTFQNQRLLYWPLLASGDYDLMKPFFDYYSDLLPMRSAITQAWFGHDGAYFRENIEPTGAERDCGKDGRPPKTPPGEAHAGWYHDYYFTSGLETLAMMTDYVLSTGDASFRDNTLLPFARQVLRFFDLHYLRSTDGKLRIDPGQVLETWWTAVNPTPDVAGLRFCLDELLAMQVGTAEDQATWSRFRAEMPEIALHDVAGETAIAPAQPGSYSNLQNYENGELYAVFPFRCFGLGLGSAGVVASTMEQRLYKEAFGSACWSQDQIQWAHAARAFDARDGLVRRFRHASTMCRFPMYGQEGPDSCPDFDHFGSGAIALQKMLVQENGQQIHLLPAWPDDWDADFKLHLQQGAVLTGTVRNGSLIEWAITPASRTTDVVVGKPQSYVPPPVALPDSNAARIIDYFADGDANGDSAQADVLDVGTYGWHDACPVFAIKMSGVSAASMIVSANFKVGYSTFGEADYGVNAYVLRTAAESTILASDYELAGTLLSGTATGGTLSLDATGKADLGSYLRTHWLQDSYVFITLRPGISSSVDGYDYPWVTSGYRFGNAGGGWTENSTDAQIIVTETTTFSAAYANWAAGKISQLDPDADATPGGDPDGDGSTNLAEFAFDGNPLDGSDHGKINCSTTDAGGTNRLLVLTIAVRSGTPAFTGTPAAGATQDGVKYSVQGSSDLAGFSVQVNPVVPNTTNLPPAGAGYEYRSFSLEGSSGLIGKGFLRASAEEVP